MNEDFALLTPQQHRIATLELEQDYLKTLCARAADALEVFKYDVDWILRKQKLIAELRKAGPVKIGDEMGLEAEIRQLRTMLSARNHDIEAYRALCARAADTLEVFKYWIAATEPLIAELRKAAQ